MGSLQVEDTSEQEIVRLRRELAHISEQCQVAHRMVMDWRQRCLASEELCRRLQKKLQRKAAKNLSTSPPLTDEIEDEALSVL